MSDEGSGRTGTGILFRFFSYAILYTEYFLRRFTYGLLTLTSSGPELLAVGSHSLIILPMNLRESNLRPKVQHS
jgi:hypothetical protein